MVWNPGHLDIGPIARVKVVRSQQSAMCDQSVSQFRHARPPALTTPTSQRTAPHPSVNTSTEYSLAMCDVIKDCKDILLQFYVVESEVSEYL